MSRFWLRATAVFAFVFVFAFSLLAQVQNGQFTGSVLDQSGAAIPNAKITVKNTATGLTQTVTSNQTGSYVIREVPPGLYSLSAQAQGFKTSTQTNVSLNAGTIQRADFHLEVGQVSQTVEVSGAAAPVNTEDSKLSTTVTSTQLTNLPLNGRNVYDLIQLAPGAVNVSGVDFENGHNTVVNGLRENFNGFLINGVNNKGLSGGVVTVPIQDSVQEFQQLQLNMSAQYGNSAGSINNLVTKSGTNAFHGSAWEYVRNDVFDANQFFLDRTPNPFNPGKPFKPSLRFNQFGFTIGGPIVKDKLFFFGAVQGDRFTTVAPPQSITVESPQWRQAVEQAFPNSTAALLYKNFPPSLGGTPAFTMDQYVSAGLTGSGFASYADYLCPDTSSPAIAAKFATLLGVTQADQAAMANVPSLGAPCSTIPALQTGIFPRSGTFIENSTAIFKSQIQTLGNLFNGNEGSMRLDYNWNSSNRMFLQVNLLKETDRFGSCNAPCTRGFSNPTRSLFPNGQLSFIHTFSPTVLNEFRAGYTQNNTGISVSLPGVPAVGFDDGAAGFGSYNGYPQFFKEHIYSYGDMVSINHGNHNIKVGADVRRNIENSEFNVARPSYSFFDNLFFAADSPYAMAAGVDPGLAGVSAGQPAALGDNIRHWRNIELGAYVQDDWKASRKLTLNLGLRYDLFTRHNEEDNLATTYVLPPGNGIVQQIIASNVPAGTPGCDTPDQIRRAQLAGVCGPGGFAPSSNLGKGNHKNFGPRFGFAYDVFGNGKTALRGGFGISYEGTLYNPLSNSRWNLPYYSFNQAINGLVGGSDYVVYGPTTCTATSCTPNPAVTPTYLGAGTNVGMGLGVQATGNLVGWAPFNPNQATLTGIIFPKGIRDPYAMNDFLGIQHEVMNNTVLEVNYVGTMGRKLFRSEDVNRFAGSRLPAGVCVTDNLGQTDCGVRTKSSGINPNGRANPNYGRLRVWQNIVNSDYNGLQVGLRRRMSHGFLFNVDYTWSHSIDNGSGWHYAVTSANGQAAGDGFTTDQLHPGLDRGNAIFDIRHRLVLNYVWELPGQHLHSVLGAIAGGWTLNGVWAFQTGAHWEPYNHKTSKLKPAPGAASDVCKAATFNAAECINVGGDYNLDNARVDRPDSSMQTFDPTRAEWANGWSLYPSMVPVFSAPCLACVGNLGRNTFVGPGSWYADMMLGKNFKFTERVNLRFEAQAFNVFNRANFILATAGGGAHNEINDPLFGEAGGTLNARNIQLGLKLSF